MRTKREVIDFLESKVGGGVPCKGNSSLDSQCVTLIKSLMEFLGVPNPYKARGHAKTAITAYINEGIADKGTGFISVFSNKNMGGGYGHIWCNAGDGNGTYYESNGQKPLIVTKGKTYPYDNVCNFDKYIKEEALSDPTEPNQLEQRVKELEGELERAREAHRVDKETFEIELRVERQARIDDRQKIAGLLGTSDDLVEIEKQITKDISDSEKLVKCIDARRVLEVNLSESSQELTRVYETASRLSTVDVASEKGLERAFQAYANNANKLPPTELDDYTNIIKLAGVTLWLRK